MTSIRSLALFALVAATVAAFAPRPAEGDFLDLPPRQVMIDATIASVELHDLLDIDFAAFGSHDTLDPIQADDVRNRVSDAQASTMDAIEDILADTGFASSAPGTASLGLLNLTLVLQDEMLDAVDRDARVRVISRPNILARDTLVATIEISKEHPIVEPRFDRGVSRRDAKAVQQFYDSAHRFHYRLMDYVTTFNGVILDLFPVAPPDISTRTVVTQVAFKDGSTLTIGGLLEFENGQKEMHTTQVPLLGDLPVVGHLFRNMGRRNSVVNEELMIFLTPKVIKQLQ
jgi:type IV pilus assembly protein PilQ